MGPSQPANGAAGLDASLPESRVLIIGTGGTICMQNGPDGLQPSKDFMASAMAPRPSFNDMSSPKGMYDLLIHFHQREYMNSLNESL